MHLSTYLKEKNLQVAQFAKLIGRSPATVYRLKKGDTKPDEQTMVRIIEATKGHVTPNDFFGVDPQ